VATGLEVDVPQLDAAPARLLAAATARRHGPDQRLVVQEEGPHAGQRPEQGFGGHGYTRAAMRTITRSPTSATGITMRR
jgi:hypothetical protein